MKTTYERLRRLSAGGALLLGLLAIWSASPAWAKPMDPAQARSAVSGWFRLSSGALRQGPIGSTGWWSAQWQLVSGQ